MRADRKRTADAIRFGKWLRATREAAGLRQREVARVMKTDTANVSLMENGYQEPSLRQLRAFARRVKATLVVELRTEG